MSLSLTATPTEERYLSGTGSDDQVAWEFYCTGGRNSGTWTTIPVPSCWELEGFGTYNYGHDANPGSEQGLYRHEFTVPSGWSGKRVDLVFEGVMTDCEVKVNGVLAGPIHQGGFTQFRFEISGLLNFGSTNLLEVTVDKRSSNSSINAAEREADYWIFGGIYRPVRLEVRPAESIQRVALNPTASGTLGGNVFLNAITAPAQLEIDVTRMDGSWSVSLSPVAVGSESTKVDFSEALSGIIPWSMEDPKLYDVTVSLTRSGQTLHTETVRTGFRDIEIRPQDGVYLNGVKIRMKGVSYHTFWPDSGRTVSRTRSEDVVERIKSMNMNTVRATSYPADKHFLETCDAEGLLVLAELPGWQDAYDDSTAARMVRELVERDVNHPSIIFWNNGNEGGWNLTVTDDYALYDPQARPVIHPGNNQDKSPSIPGPKIFNGLDTNHYPTWSQLQTRLSRSDLYFPTEILHGLYDGGHGAGFDEYWEALRASPVGVGMILWVLADEGVVRTDLGGGIDTDGNHAPDGIFGPYGEPEPSFETIRDIWSPAVVTTDPVLDATYDGSIALLNDYTFTNLDTVRFDWELGDFPRMSESGANGFVVNESGSLMGPSVSPQSTGNLFIPLPVNWQAHDALRLVATDANGLILRSWIWPIRSKTELLQANLPGDTIDTVTITDGGSDWVLASGDVELRIGKASGLVQELRSGGVQTGLTNGPRLVAGSASLSSISTRKEGADGVVEATFNGNLDSLVYRMSPGGVMEINYSMNLSGSYANVGLTFDHDTSLVMGLRWLGGGPDPVWKNRIGGAKLGVWEKASNTNVPGEEWSFAPVFRGNHADLHWATVQSTAPALNFLTDTEGVFFRMLTPSPGSDPKKATFTMPPGDISLLHGISAVGNKFMFADATGPAGALNTVFGTISGRFHLIAGDVDPRPKVVTAEYVSPYRVRIQYDRSMDVGASDASAYSLSPYRRIHSVLQESDSVYLLDIEPLESGVSYSLTIDPALATSGGELLRLPNSFNLDAPAGPLFVFAFDEATGGTSSNHGSAGGVALLNGSAGLEDAYRHTGLHLTGASGGASFASPNLNAFTVSAWVRLDTEVAGTYPRIVSFGDDNVQWTFDISSAEYPRSIAFNAAGLGDWRSAANVLPATGTWMHLAVVFDSATGLDPVFYMNGASLPVFKKGTPAGSYDPSGASGIGNRITDWGRMLPGWIDELRIDNRILSAAEISALAARMPTVSYAAYMANWPTLDSSLLGDPDLDGVVSLIEYMTGTNPSEPSVVPYGIRSDDDGVSVSFTTSDVSMGYAFFLEASDDLGPGNWTEVESGAIEPYRFINETLEWKWSWNPNTTPRRFVRIGVR